MSFSLRHLRYRITQRRRQELAMEIQEARRELAAAQCHPGAPADLLKEIHERGLAGLAGGWEGSEELVERLAESHRTGPRGTPELG
jgi:hypothetical protein